MGIAPYWCCCDCALWRRCLQCHTSNEIWICDGSKCVNGDTAGVNTVFDYGGVCYAVTDTINVNPAGPRIPPGTRLVCVADCSACDTGSCTCWKGYKFGHDPPDGGPASLTLATTLSGNMVGCGCFTGCCTTCSFNDYVGTLNFQGLPGGSCSYRTINADRQIPVVATDCDGQTFEVQYVSQLSSIWLMRYSNSSLQVGEQFTGWSTGTPDPDGFVIFDDEPVVVISGSKEFGAGLSGSCNAIRDFRAIDVWFAYGLASNKWYLEVDMDSGQWECFPGTPFWTLQGFVNGTVNRIGTASFLVDVQANLTFTGKCALSGCQDPLQEVYNIGGTFGAAYGDVFQC